MRALVLIVVCVILLAVLQASYHIVDAQNDNKKQTSFLVTDDSDQVHSHHQVSSSEVNDHQGAVHQVVLTPSKHKRTKDQGSASVRHNRYTVGTNPDSYNGTKILDTDPDIHTSQSELRKKLRAQRKLCRTNPEKCDRKNGSGKNTHRKGKPEKSKSKDRESRRREKELKKQKNKTRQGAVDKVFQYKPAREKERNNTILQVLHIRVLNHPDSTDQSPTSKEQNFIHLVETRQRASDNQTKQEPEPDKEKNRKKNKNKSSTLSIYDAMVGDSPSKSSENLFRSHHQRPSGENLFRNNKNHPRRSRKHGGKRERGSRKGGRTRDKDCESSDQCRTGECCVVTKSGRKQCKRSGRRREGKRCTNSCLCETGLQCFVSDYNSNGRLKKSRRKNNTIITVGKCTSSVNMDVSKGFLLATSPVTPGGKH